MAYIIMVRHGETAWNRENRLQGRLDVPLNDCGRLQALLIALFLTRVPFGGLHASPLIRAYDTARAIGALTGLKPHASSDLLEMDFGRWEGKHMHEIEAQCPGFARVWERRPYRVRFPGGETFRSLQERVLGFLNGLSGGSHVVVTHGQVIRSVVWWCLGLPLEQCPRLPVFNGSITLLSSDTGGLAVKAVNVVGHLKGIHRGFRCLGSPYPLGSCLLGLQGEGIRLP